MNPFEKYGLKLVRRDGNLYYDFSGVETEDLLKIVVLKQQDPLKRAAIVAKNPSRDELLDMFLRPIRRRS